MKDKQQSVESITVQSGNALLIATQNLCDFTAVLPLEDTGDIGDMVSRRCAPYEKKWRHGGFEERKVFPSKGYVCRRENRGRGERI